MIATRVKRETDSNASSSWF